jgi:TrmH family RNA methyltransferase
MITSLKNDRVRYVQALQKHRKARQRERRFVFEGVRLIEEAVRAGVAPEYAFYTEDALAAERGPELIESMTSLGATCYPVSEAVLSACSDTKTPQGIVAVLPIPDLPRPAEPTLTLIADGVRDPGNLGTMLRTALATGVELMILAPGTVDASNPKVVRSAMGAHLRLPITALRWQVISDTMGDAHVRLAAADGEVAYTSVDWTEPAALIVGGEGAGAGERARELARERVSIPMAAGVESLNTAIAAAVILFEVRRQRLGLSG